MGSGEEDIVRTSVIGWVRQTEESQMQVKGTTLGGEGEAPVEDAGVGVSKCLMSFFTSGGAVCVCLLLQYLSSL